MSETARHRAKRRGQSKPDSALTSRSLLSFLVAFLLACGDVQATAPAAPTQPAPAPVPTSMVITPPTATLAALAQTVQLTATGLTGEIPRDLGNLTDVNDLHLSGNKLTGQIPPELGDLARLVQLYQLEKLRVIYLSDNPLTGVIPQALVNLPLAQFHWTGTMLCAPANQAFQTWLEGIWSHRGGETCAP